MISSILAWLWFSIMIGMVPVQAANDTASNPVQAASTPITHTNIAIKKENVLRNPVLLKNAQTALSTLPELSGQPIYVFEKVHFFNGTRPRIELAIQNPQQPNALLFYTYEHGTWQASPAEDVSHLTRIDRYFVPLDSIDFAQAAQIAQTWQDHANKMQAIETEPYYVAWVWLPAQKKRFWHTAILEAVGTQYYLSCHEDGRVWEWKRLAGQSPEGNDH